MKKIFFIILLLLCISPCFAIVEQKNILILSDEKFLGNNYYVFSNASNVIAREIINDINLKDGINKAYRQDFIKKKLEYTYSRQRCEEFMEQYKASYSIDFDILKKMNRYVDADYILIISSNTDVQSEFLKETFWNVLNVPGQDVIKPQYMLSVHITFIDLRKYEVLFENTFKEPIKAKNLNIGMVQSGPNDIQLAETERIAKKISKKVITDIEYTQTHNLTSTMNNVECKKAIYNENYHNFVADKKLKHQQRKEKSKQKKAEKSLNKKIKKETKIQEKIDLKNEKEMNKLREKDRKEELKRLEREEKEYQKLEEQRKKDFIEKQTEIIKIKDKKYYSEEKNKKELTDEQKKLIKMIENL